MTYLFALIVVGKTATWEKVPKFYQDIGMNLRFEYLLVWSFYDIHPKCLLSFNNLYTVQYINDVLKQLHIHMYIDLVPYIKLKVITLENES